MIRLLADESLTGRTREFLRKSGYALLTVEQLGRRGAKNGEVLALAKAQQAIVVAEDRGFSNILDYPLGTHEGIIVLKIRKSIDIDPINLQLHSALQVIPSDLLKGSLLIVDPTKYRLRRPA